MMHPDRRESHLFFAMRSFSIGAAVVLDGLSAVQYNGHQGIILGKLVGDRYPIRVASLGKDIKIKPVNLMHSQSLLEALDEDAIRELLQVLVRTYPATAVSFAHSSRAFEGRAAARNSRSSDPLGPLDRSYRNK